MKPAAVRANQKKLARLNIVSELFKKGWSMRQIRAEVMKRLDLSTYSTGTVKHDVDSLIKEWRDSRLKDMDDCMELELARIDDTCKELWDQWEKSKEDFEDKVSTRKGVPGRRGQNGEGQPGDDRIHTTEIKERTRSVQGLGDTRYIAEIRAQLGERRKLLGLYAPEKKDVQGQMSFAAFLEQSGLIDEAEKTEDDPE